MSSQPNTARESPPAARPRWTPGLPALVGMGIGGLTTLIGVLSVFNAFLGLDLAIGVGGADVALPRFVNTAWPVVVVGLGIGGGSAAGSYLAYALKRTASWPLRIGLVLLVLAGLTGVGWLGVQAVQLQTYGSLAATHAANGRVASLEAELEAGVSDEIADDCMGRAVQFDEAEAVGVLLAHGIDPVGQFDDGETFCHLEGASAEVLAVAAEHGWSADCGRTAALGDAP